MTPERTISVQRPETQIQTGIDFASIGNPLGRSPFIDQHGESFIVSESDVLTHFSHWLRIPADHIAIAKGSSALIETLPSICMKRGDSCVLPVPTYFGLEESLEPLGVRTIRVQAPIDQGYKITRAYKEQVLSEIRTSAPSLVWLCSPNNPTGVSWELSDIAEIAEASSALVIVDEAYQDYVDPDNEESAIRLIPDHENILVTKTFSKAFGMPESRIGIAIADPKLISKIRNQSIEKPSAEALSLAIEAIGDIDHVRRTAKYIKEESRFLENSIADMNHIHLGSTPACGIAILRHESLNLHDLLQLSGIEARDINTQEGLEGFEYVRIGIKTRRENIRLIEALRLCDQLIEGRDILLQRRVDPSMIEKVHSLMKAEFMGVGGKLRDCSLEDFTSLVSNRGQLWTVTKGESILASCTIESLNINAIKWLYINNGLVCPELRHKGGQLQSSLIQKAMNANNPKSRYIVITHAHSIFERLGFRAVSLDQLQDIDPDISTCIEPKIRQDDPATIYIKIPSSM